MPMFEALLQLLLPFPLLAHVALGQRTCLAQRDNPSYVLVTARIPRSWCPPCSKACRGTPGRDIHPPMPLGA